MQTDLKTGIANFYDESSGLWESMWGDHMHHGYYPEGGPPKNNQQAQVDMIEETLKWAGVSGASSMVDVGCGIGGSSRHISRKFGCKATGITLSPVQAARANDLTAAAGLADKLSFQVGDALQQPFPDSSFDLVWSLESGEHMPNKKTFVSELARPGEKLTEEEQSLLDRICEAYYLPEWCSVADYETMFAASGLEQIRSTDWSKEVAPFWKAVIQTALSAAGFQGLMKAGWTTIKGALVMPLMAQGLKTGLVRFNLITARKPKQ
ncbi:MAG: hypothetical protein WDW38_003724 [Sanguina aurantia]